MEKTLGKTTLATALLLGLGSLAAADASAQSFGAEVLFGSDTDFGIGARGHVPLGTTAPLEVQGGFAIFFPDGPVDYWEVNGNLWYLIETSGSSNAVPYVGGGLNIGVLDAGSSFDTDTELGLNLGGGARFEFTNTTPFVEARFVIGGVEQFVFGGGVMFGRF